jgi:hypothetical protein
VGQKLVQSKLISQKTLDHALEIQKMVTANDLTPGQATDALKDITKSGTSVEKAIAQAREQRPAGASQLLSISELIRLVGIVPLEDMESSTITSKSENRPILDVLIHRKLIAPNTLSAVMRAHDLLLDRKLSSEQAIFALHSWLWSQGEFDDLLHNLGWLN